MATMAYQVPVPDGVAPGGTFAANLGGQVVNVLVPEGVQPGMMMEVQGPVAAVTGAPVGQTMSDTSLAACEGLFVKQKASLTEAVTQGACEKRNKYKVFAKQGGKKSKDKLFKAKEDSECFGRCCCAPNHQLQVRVKDDEKTHYTIAKPFAFVGCWGCCECCQPRADVYRGEWNPETPEQGDLIASIKRPGCLEQGTQPMLKVYDKSGSEMGKFLGPNCCIGSCCDTKFDYYHGEEVVGKIEKVQKGGAEGMAREMFTDADNFGIDFPPNASEEEKAAMLGTMFLLDFMFFEDDGAMKCDGGSLEIKCCDMYCCGCKCPCKLVCGGGEGGD